MNWQHVSARFVSAPRTGQAVTARPWLPSALAAVGTVVIALMPVAIAAPVTYQAEPRGAVDPQDEAARPRPAAQELDTVIEEVQAKLAAIKRRSNLEAGVTPTAESALAVTERFHRVRAEMADQLTALRQRLVAAERTIWLLWPNGRRTQVLDRGLIGLRPPAGDSARRPSR